MLKIRKTWEPPLSMLALHTMYVQQHMSIQEMADTAGVSINAIWRWLNWYTIPRRKQGRAGAEHHGWQEEAPDGHGYIKVWQPGHPRAIRGRVLRCVSNWEKANGRPFPEGKEPHHKNNVKTDDRASNIEPLTHAEHSRLKALEERRQRGQFGRQQLRRLYSKGPSV